jgi:hypothetical protein
MLDSDPDAFYVQKLIAAKARGDEKAMSEVKSARRGTHLKLNEDSYDWEYASVVRDPHEWASTKLLVWDRRELASSMLQYTPYSVQLFIERFSGFTAAKHDLLSEECE